MKWTKFEHVAKIEHVFEMLALRRVSFKKREKKSIELALVH